jgi:hypothetical protein
MVSAARLWKRKSGFVVNDWMMDSGAFSEISMFGTYRHSEEEYAELIDRFRLCGNLLCAVSQDYMCEPFIVQRTGLSVITHQRLTVDRYKRLNDICKSVYILPVIQGYQPSEYVNHLSMYGDWLETGAWVGVGSVCKRNSRVESIVSVLEAIRNVRSDLRLHGFGLKQTALKSAYVRSMLYSADSMAWSFVARRAGRNANDYREALIFQQNIENQQLSRVHQLGLF